MSPTRWEPDNFVLETNTVWSFPERGDWATHDAKYSGIVNQLKKTLHWRTLKHRNLLVFSYFNFRLFILIHYNWSPYIPRNLLLRYSSEGDLVLDQFAGGGTTLVEAKLLNRNILGVDINPVAIER